MSIGVYNSAAFTSASGVAVAASADVEVRRMSDGALASIFSDRAGASGITQPGFQADSNGRFVFYAAGRADGYSVKVTAGAETHTLNNVPIGLAQDFDIVESWRSALGAALGAIWNTVLATATVPEAQTALGIVVKRKTADESVASSTTLQDDDHLVIPIGANEEWIVSYELNVGAALSSTGMKLTVTGPTGALGQVQAFMIGGTNGQSGRGRNTLGGAIQFAAASFTGDGYVGVEARIANGGTAGNVTLQWAQDTSSGSNLTVRTGSPAVAHRIA